MHACTGNKIDYITHMQEEFILTKSINFKPSIQIKFRLHYCFFMTKPSKQDYIWTKFKMEQFYYKAKKIHNKNYSSV